jgi:hypothetical protein
MIGRVFDKRPPRGRRRAAERRTASGYRLIYTETLTPAFADQMRTGKISNLSYRVG